MQCWLDKATEQKDVQRHAITCKNNQQDFQSFGLLTVAEMSETAKICRFIEFSLSSLERNPGSACDCRGGLWSLKRSPSTQLKSLKSLSWTDLTDLTLALSSTLWYSLIPSLRDIYSTSSIFSDLCVTFRHSCWNCWILWFPQPASLVDWLP